MSRWFLALSLFCGIALHAGVEVFNTPENRVYAIQDAQNSFPASLFAGSDPQERFAQTETEYEGSVNVFIVESKNDKRRIMIDAGFGAPRGQLLAEMKKVKLAPESVTDILITHIHPDHVGGLPQFPNAKVHIAREEYDAWLRDPARKNLAKFLPDAKSLDLFAYGAELFPGLVALKAPGHTPGHTVYRLNDRYFVGDIVHAAKLQIVHPAFCARYDRDPALAAASRRKALKEFRGEWFGAHIPFPGCYLNGAPTREKPLPVAEFLKNFEKVDTVKESGSLFGPRVYLGTAGTPENYNSLTLGWGATGVLWGRPTAIVYIRENRYSFRFFEESPVFVLSWYPKQHMKALFRVFGKTSGRDTDKEKLSGFTPVETPDGGVTYLQAETVVICRKVMRQRVPGECMPPELRKRLDQDGLVHIQYTGEVLSVWRHK